MRDPARIDPFIERLRVVWRENPDLRFGQILSVMSSFFPDGVDDPFYLEDDMWRMAIAKAQDHLRIMKHLEES